MTKRSGVLYSQKGDFKYKAVMILPDLLVAGEQLPDLCCHLDVSHWRDIYIGLYGKIQKVPYTSSAPIDEFKL